MSRLHKINICYSTKDSVERIRKATDWEKIFAKDITQRTIFQNIQRTVKTQLQKTNYPIEKWTKDFKKLFQERDTDVK